LPGFANDAAYDAEYVGGLLALLRVEHPDEPLSRLADMIDWDGVALIDETHQAFYDRMYGPMESL